MDHQFYFQTLYPFQSYVLQIINQLETEFYLTGGTAASRAYLQHRFSDDLDLFVNDDNRFSLWGDRIIHALTNHDDWQSTVLLKEKRFVRIMLKKSDVMLKVELINDVPARVGPIHQHSILGRIDSAENILANKVTAILSREDAKDFADIWGFCTQLGYSLREAIENAHSKAAGIFHADLARVLCSVTQQDWELVRWITAPDFTKFKTDLYGLGESLLLIDVEKES